jgi:serine/threonine protein kinase
MPSFFELPPDSVLGGDFRILSAQKAGYLKSTYLAEQISTASTRMLTLLHPQLVHDPVSRQRFEHEIAMAAEIRSEHVAAVLGGGVDPSTEVGWVATELLEGQSLSSYLESSYLERRGSLQLPEICEIFTQLGAGLAAAHALGLVHRDLNPATIFIAEPRLDGLAFTVKILDFGVGHLVTASERIGNAGFDALLFQAPEQAIPGKGIGPATDFWALGLLAFRLMTGVHYWQSANVEPRQVRDLLREIVLEPLALPSERAAARGAQHLVPRGLDDWFSGCLARPLEHRFSRIAELCVMLDALAERAGVPSRVSSIPVPEPTSRTLAPVAEPTRSALPALLIGAVVGVLFVTLSGRFEDAPGAVSSGVELGSTLPVAVTPDAAPAPADAP